MTFRKVIFSRPYKVTVNVSWQPVNITLLSTTPDSPANSVFPSPLSPPWLPIWVQNNTVVLTTVFPKPPIRQYDWPVPRTPVRPISAYTNINTPRPSQIPNVKPQNRQTNWPLPIRLPPPLGQFWFNTPQPSNIPANIKPPNRQSDWPVPIRIPYPVNFYTFLESGNAILPLPVDKPSSSQWPTPFVAAEIRQHIPPNIALLNTSPAVSFPRNQFDWPAAKRLPQIQVFYQQNNQGLLASITFMPPVVSSWNVPINIQIQSFQPPNIAIRSSVVAPTTPFNQTNWPASQRLSAVPFQYVNMLSLLTAPAITFMPSQAESWIWNPLPYFSYSSLAPNVAIRTPVVVVPLPFNQYGWPLPIAPINITSERTWTASPKVPPVDQPGNAVFPLPAAPVISVQWNASNTLPLLTAPPPVKPPNRQGDWPVPQRPIQLKPDSPINIALTHAGIDTTNIPARASDWPIPIQPQRTSISSYTNINRPIIIPNVAPPNRQSIWPLPPRLPPPLGQFWANTPGPSLIPNVRPPNRQSYWPLPPRLLPPVGQFWAQSPHTIPPSPVVPSQFDPYVWSEADWRKHQKRLKKRQLELDKEDKQKAKLREQLLRLYRGIDDDQFAQLPSDDILPVRLQAHEDHLDQIALQLAQMQDQLKRHQRELVRRYLADMESKRDEEEIEMLMSIL